MFKIKRIVCLFLINHIFLGTHFFSVKIFLARLAGIQVGNNVSIVGPLILSNVCNLRIGNNCWLGKNMEVCGNGSVLIGDNVDIAPNVLFFTGGHEIGTSKKRAGKGLNYEIEVKEGCWIGASVSLFNNITVEEGVVIGLGSLVNRSCSKNTIYAGNPARIIKKIDIE